MSNLIVLEKYLLHNRISSISYDSITSANDVHFTTIYPYNQVYKISAKGEVIEVLDLPFQINCLYYHKQDNCFWASSFNTHNKLYKLDRQLKPISQLALPSIPEVSLYNKEDLLIKNISFNSRENSFIINTNKIIYQVNKKGQLINYINLSPDENITYGAITTVNDHLIITTYDLSKTSVFIYDVNTFSISNDYCYFENKMFISSIALEQIKTNNTCTLIALAKDNTKQNYLLQLMLVLDLPEQEAELAQRMAPPIVTYYNSTPSNSRILKMDPNEEELDYDYPHPSNLPTNDSYNEAYNEPPYQSPIPEKDPQLHTPESIFSLPDLQEEALTWPTRSEHTLEHALSDIVESLALNHLSLAKLFSVESDRMTKALSFCQSYDDLLEQNQLFSTNINNLSDINQALYQELALALENLSNQ